MSAETKTKGEVLMEEVKSLIGHFEKDSTRHKKLYRKLRYAALILTGSATIMSGAALTLSGWEAVLNLAVVVVTATAAVIASVEGIRKPAELWIQERSTLHALKDLKRRIEFENAPSDEMEKSEEHFSDLETILRSAAEKWSKQVSRSQPNTS